MGQSRIDKNKLMTWLDEKNSLLGEYRVKGSKIHLNSPWSLDYKYHLALLPNRGKNGRFRDWKSGKNGNLFEFVMEIDRCNFGEACKKIGANSEYTYNVDQMIREKEKERLMQKYKAAKEHNFRLPSGCIRIEKKNDDIEARRGRMYLKSRGLYPTDYEFYICTKNRQIEADDGVFTQRLSNRLLVPYYNQSGEFVYWTARAIDPQEKVRYLEPFESEVPAKKQDVIFTPEWDFQEDHVFVTEGPLDALSIWVTGFSAVAIGGSGFFKGQANILKSMKSTPILAMDFDKAGKNCMRKAYNLFGENQCKIIFPPKDHDWNSALVSAGRKALGDYLQKNIQPFTDVLRFGLEISSC